MAFCLLEKPGNRIINFSLSPSILRKWLYDIYDNIFNNLIIPDSSVGILHCLVDSFSDAWKSYIIDIFKINIHDECFNLLSLNVTNAVCVVINELSSFVFNSNSKICLPIKSQRQLYNSLHYN